MPHIPTAFAAFQILSELQAHGIEDSDLLDCTRSRDVHPLLGLFHLLALL